MDISDLLCDLYDIKRQAKFLSMEKASVLAGLEVANELLNSDKVEIKSTYKRKL